MERNKSIVECTPRTRSNLLSKTYFLVCKLKSTIRYTCQFMGRDHDDAVASGDEEGTVDGDISKIMIVVVAIATGRCSNLQPQGRAVPLGWEGGKPIPYVYWLFKLHGLNHFYLCEENMAMNLIAAGTTLNYILHHFQ
jgi:hypothetical protein